MNKKKLNVDAEVTARIVKALEVIMITDSRFPTWKSICDKTGFITSSVAKWRTSEVNCTVSDLHIVSQLFHVNPMYLVDGTGDMFYKRIPKAPVTDPLALIDEALSSLQLARKAIENPPMKNGTKKRYKAA